MSGTRYVLDVVPGLRELARRHEGITTRAQLRTLGVSSDHVAEQVRAGRWRTIGPHLVVLHTGAVSRSAQLGATLLHAGPDGALAAWTGLQQAGLRRWERAAVHVVVARGRTVAPLPGLVLHESRRFDPHLDVDPGAPLRSLRPARCAIDAASWTPRADTGVALLAATVQQRITTVADLRDELSAAGSIRHGRHLREHLGVLAAGADTLGEIRLGRLLQAAGLPAPRRQQVVRVRGREGHTDCEVDLPDGSVLVLEVDGDDHNDERARVLDSLRDLSNAAATRPTVRVTPWALVHRRAELLAALRAVREAAQARAAYRAAVSGSAGPSPYRH